MKTFALLTHHSHIVIQRLAVLSLVSLIAVDLWKLYLFQCLAAGQPECQILSAEHQRRESSHRPTAIKETRERKVTEGMKNPQKYSTY